MAEVENMEQTTNSQENAAQDEDFSPKGSMFLMTVYIMIFAAAWGMVYFTDLLARR